MVKDREIYTEGEGESLHKFVCEVSIIKNLKYGIPRISLYFDLQLWTITVETSSLCRNTPNFDTFLLSVKLYNTFIRLKIEYGLAIFNFNKRQVTRLESIQDNRSRLIVGGKLTSSMKGLPHHD
ncbi:MAG: hypothetical protein EXX96DRAFT_541230 [Benjaminiella poitrasii]|nr:MAG: hypothetical protein EXX96DRAFT_541230 [Benjaminiella poitrasii]